MKYKDEFETVVETCAYDKWVNIDIEGLFIVDGNEGKEKGAISINIPKDKALELAKMITDHFSN
ncbi:hypothetical protein VPHK233G2_0019 [Vibrio phage K233 g2]